MILPQSRYFNNSTQARLPNSAGVYNVTVLRTTPANDSTGYKLYTWSAGDRPDLVAAKFLGDPQLWWQIFDINPEVFDPLNVPPGQVIRIPTTPSQLAGGTLLQ